MRTVLIVVTLYAFTVGLTSAVAGKEDAIVAAIGGLLLVWGLACWKTVRLNSDFFRFARYRELLVYLVGGGLIGAILDVSGMAMIGFGHGSSLPITIFFGILENAPEELPLPFLLYPAYGAVLWAGRLWTFGPAAGIAVLLLHYTSVAFALAISDFNISDELHYFKRVWEFMPIWVVSGFGVFIFAHFFVLRSIGSRTRNITT